MRPAGHTVVVISVLSVRGSGKGGLCMPGPRVYRLWTGKPGFEETSMADFDELLQDLKQKRDQLRVRIHLASRELQDEWEELEKKTEDFTRRARLKETGSNVSKALALVGDELKAGYKRIQRAMKDD
jgi:hypothetical protein